MVRPVESSDGIDEGTAAAEQHRPKRGFLCAALFEEVQ
jgi:hypothetical protein